MKQATPMKLTGRCSRFTWAALISALLLFAFTPPASADPQGAWVLPAKNLSAAGKNAFDVQIAVAPNGTATAVWRSYNGSGPIIQAATRPSGGSFGAAVNLSVAGQRAYSPQIAIGPNGAATVVWYRSNRGEGVVQAATRPPGGSFGAAVNLSPAGGKAYEPQIAIAANGAATVVWDTYVDFAGRIQAVTRPPGGSFGAAVGLSAAGGNASSPQVAIAPNGATTVVWYLRKSTVPRIQAATRPPGSSFGAVVNLSAADEDDPLPQIAIAPNGTATVVWGTFVGGITDRIRAVTRPPGGSFGAVVGISAAGQNAYDPQIAVAPGGATTAVWERHNGTNLIIQAATRPPGGSFGAAVNLSAAGRSAFDPQVAIARDGTVTAVWFRSNGANHIIQAATRPPGGSFGAAVNLSAAGRNAYEPQVAIGPNGTATAVWQRWNGAKAVNQSVSTALPSRISKLRVSGPARVKKGRVVIYRVRITNSNKAAATGVRLKVDGRGAGFNAPVGRIAVGTTRTVNVRVRPNRPGRVVATFRVTSFNAGGKTVKKRIFVSR